MNPEEILKFWFDELETRMWWVADDALDATIRARFGHVLEAALRCELWGWRATPRGRLAEIVTIDQFSRNIHRGTPRAFAGDALALALAQEAIWAGADAALEPSLRAFMYLPFMHSESALIHDRAMALFAAPGLERNLEAEHEHKAIIDRFGRYPHRNAILGRASTPEEATFLEEPGSSFGQNRPQRRARSSVAGEPAPRARPIQYTPSSSQAKDGAPKTDEQRVEEAIRVQRPQFARRFREGVKMTVLEQSFFLRSRIIDVSSLVTAPPRTIHAALIDDAAFVLTGHIEHINALVGRDPPPLLADEASAMAYGSIMDHWSTDNVEYGCLLIRCWEDIPFFSDLGKVERDLMDYTRDLLAPFMGPPTIHLEGDEWVLVKWLVTGGALVRRDLHIRTSGEIRRHDEVYDSELPVPKGERWGVDETGRLVPIG